MPVCSLPILLLNKNKRKMEEEQADELDDLNEEKKERVLEQLGIADGIYCCGKQLFSEDGINDSIFFKCEKCGSCFNVIYSKEEIEE